ncbi:MFS transporter [Pseudomonas sp. DTU_2021_1001937_2_SI_NGA_ILE_001]|uniref:MFS transporter n=1 Tax=Pseudomonas sp. DTU_2021_1001937_2_SI_NGA_ILE_001 TaxID=3077589 RepID=UPI0028FC0BF4|nr:MFS transporter [Pseudomonas sp. DTU_2021_1001937_2_SI_NGA_ILE_001]WNW10031.1 MFS transporter [Pseudomonas sp. DTU_2021_1001937_2_SI_NGA_ILE_001]
MTTLNEKTLRTASGRREGAVLVLGSSLTVMGAVMVAPVMPQIGAEFGPTTAHADALVPLVVAGPALAIALFAPLAGWLADRIGRKNLLLLGTLFYALLGALPLLLHDLLSIVVVRLLFGCAEAAVMTCCATLIADYWHGEERMRYVNRQVVTIGSVGALFFVAGGALGEHSWRLPFALYLLPLLLLPLMARWLWEPPRQAAQQPVAGERGRVALGSLLIGYALVFVGMILTFVVPVQTPGLLVAMGVTSSTLIGLSAGLGLLSTLLGSLLWPLVRRSLGVAGGNALLLVLLGVGLWLLMRATSYSAVLLAVFCHGVGAGLLVPNVMAPVMNALTARTRGRGLGVFTACLYLGQFISPMVVLGVAAFAGSVAQAIFCMALAGLCLAALCAAVAVQRRQLARADLSPLNHQE